MKKKISAEIFLLLVLNTEVTLCVQQLNCYQKLQNILINEDSQNKINIYGILVEPVKQGFFASVEIYEFKV